MSEKIEKLVNDIPGLRDVAAGREVFWRNPKVIPFEEAKPELPLSLDDIKDAEARLLRFAPLIMKLFPETEKRGGIIESDLTEIPNMWRSLREDAVGKLYLKRDSDLDVAGSVKARGGIYEVLKHTEELAFENRILESFDDDYEILAGAETREILSKYKMQVGSTGNLGMSIGIMSAALGYQAIVHMSQDAKEWKKDYLRKHGVTVVEYDGDYGEAVAKGRADSDSDPMSYFVDDENSQDLFLGYAVAAFRLQKQISDAGIEVDENHPLFVYIPCGVGGAPGGIAFGLKQVYGDNVEIYFVEPTEAPCMLLGLATGIHSEISVKDVGLSGQTHADGLAVARPSGFVGKVMEPLLAGEMTVEDCRLYEYLRMLRDSEGLFIEPSSCAGFHGPLRLLENTSRTRSEIEKATHIVWATGGRLVPEDQRREFYETFLAN